MSSQEDDWKRSCRETGKAGCRGFPVLERIPVRPGRPAKTAEGNEESRGLVLVPSCGANPLSGLHLAAVTTYVSPRSGPPDPAVAGPASGRWNPPSVVTAGVREGAQRPTPAKGPSRGDPNSLSSRR